MRSTEFARPRGAVRSPLAPRPHRRPVHRPAFDVLECRILPTIPVIQYPLPDGDAYPTSLVTGADGTLWFLMEDGDEIGRIAPDGTVTMIPLGPPPAPNVYQSADIFLNSLILQRKKFLASTQSVANLEVSS